MRRFYWTFLFFLYTVSLSAADIAVLTIAHGHDYQNKVKLGIENKRVYCQQHGYDFIYCEDSLDPSRHIYWSKILLVLKTLENSSYRWVVWMDADTLVMNQDIPLEDIINEKYNFLITQDWNGINSGIFFIRNCEWSFKFLNSVYERTDCLFHTWPEQIAIASELNNKKEFSLHTKVFPQRLFNSYPSETSLSLLSSTYQPGDFIIHFASARDGFLTQLFDKYSQQVLNDRERFTLDQYLSCYGFTLSPTHSENNEGYLSDEQKEEFKERLALYPHIRSILEIGLNGGHSAENFFQCCKNLNKFVSFDINMHAYTTPAVEYFSRKYKERFEFIQGDSTLTIPKYAELFPDEEFDLIYIDGNHTYEACRQDILNCQKLANPNTILWIDDYTWFIQDAVTSLEESGVIVIKDVHRSWGSHGGRFWVEARYLFPPSNDIIESF
jgi:mannan polymerase II complex MNN10 subunit